MSKELWSVILYGRTSKDDKRRLTIEIQKQMLARWLASDPDAARVVAEQWDSGVSGKIPFADRPGGAQVMDWVRAHEGEKTVLVVCYVDRFARDTLSGIATAKELNSQGTLLVAINEGLDARRETSSFQFNLRLCFAEEEWHRIQERTATGKKRWIEEHNTPPGGSIQFGFLTDREGKWIRHAFEGPIVQRCFELIDEGSSQRDVARWFFKLKGVSFGRRYQKKDGSDPTYFRGGGKKEYNQSFICKMLRSRAYVGERTWGGKVYPVEPIVPRELFERVQRKLAKGGAGQGRKQPRESPALLSGILRCGTCGRPMFGICKRRKMACQGQGRESLAGSSRGDSGVERTEGKRAKLKAPERFYRCYSNGGGELPPCKGRQFGSGELDSQLWPILESYVLNPSALLAKAVAADCQERAALDRIGETEQGLRAALEACDKEALDVWEMQRRNALPLSFVESGLRAIQERREATLRRLALIQEQSAAAQERQEECAAVASAVGRLRELLPQAESDLAKRAEIARALVKTAVAETVRRGRWGESKIHIELRWGEVITAANCGENAQAAVGGAKFPGIDARNASAPTIPLSFTVAPVSA